MITLITKDGARNGNGIIYGGDTVCDTSDGLKERHRFFVETDFGNRLVLTWNEVNELFLIGRVVNYDFWRMERDEHRMQNSLKDRADGGP